MGSNRQNIKQIQDLSVLLDQVGANWIPGRPIVRINEEYTGDYVQFIIEAPVNSDGNLAWYKNINKGEFNLTSPIIVTTVKVKGTGESQWFGATIVLDLEYNNGSIRILESEYGDVPTEIDLSPSQILIEYVPIPPDDEEIQVPDTSNLESRVKQNEDDIKELKDASSPATYKVFATTGENTLNNATERLFEVPFNEIEAGKLMVFGEGGKTYNVTQMLLHLKDPNGLIAGGSATAPQIYVTRNRGGSYTTMSSLITLAVGVNVIDVSTVLTTNSWQLADFLDFLINTALGTDNSSRITLDVYVEFTEVSA